MPLPLLYGDGTMNLWCGHINKPHIIVALENLRQCVNCHQILPHFTVVHDVRGELIEEK